MRNETLDDVRSDLMRMEAWYLGVLLAWLVLGLPSILIGIGFAGGNPFWDLDFRQFSALGVVLWLLCVTFLLAPIWLAPFGLKKAKSRKWTENDTD